ncbi:MAG: hypothetical protein MMC23_005082 [Stictis urceolatum]|nr:hypothetical protein [Stictis urceolata]
MAAVAPAQLGSRLENNDTAMDGSDVDAEGEEDVDMEYNAVAAGVTEPISNSKNGNDQGDEDNEDDDQDQSEAEGQEPNKSELSDAVGEEDDDAEGDDDDDDDEVVGAVKIPQGQNLDSDTESDEEAESSEEEAARRRKKHSGSDDSEESDSEAESEAVEDWEDASAGEGETDIAARNNCIFCKQDEESDPSEEFEEYLSCAVCGDNAHRQCARDAKSLLSDEQAGEWRCPPCVTNSLGTDNDEADEAAATRRLSTSSRLTRDLLPATRSGSKPGSHSIFNTLIVQDDPLDGSRALRKRKSSSEARDQSTASSKRQKRNSTDEVAVSSSASSSVAGDDEFEDQVKLEDTSNRRRDARSSEKSKLDGEEGTGRPSRPRRQKHEAARVRPLIRESHRLIIAIRVDTSKVKERPPKKSRRTTITSSGHARFGAAPTTMHYSAPFYSLQDREVDESKIKPYGGILSEAEADTSKTFPATVDRARFEEARQKAEEEWKLKTAASEAENETKGRTSQKISGPPSKIKCINFGGYEIDTWYAAPYPEEYSRNRVLYICEFCLKYMPSDYVAWRHKLKCPAKHPPGDEIYRDKSVSIFEVDGRKNPVYCQNLCLLAKLFLGSKTLYYDVEPFLFYIMTEYDDLGYHFVGYFSKEKRPSSMNNVSCILTLPIHQRKGYGNLLMDFSYLLTRAEQKTGSPEKPLSDMGLVSYRNYWRLVLAYTLLDQTESLSISKISDRTGMTADDIIAGLEALRALVRDPVTKSYALRLDRTFLKETIDKWEAKKYVKLSPDALIWTPYIMGHFNLTNYDRGAISTVAPREDEDEQPAPEEGVQQQQAAEAASASTSQPNGTLDESTSITLDPIIDSSILAQPPSIPSKPSASAPPSPPKTNGINPVPASIPSTPIHIPTTIHPTRFEIYPPIPGTIARRRTAKGGRRTTYTPGSLSVRRDRHANGTGTSRVNGISPRHITTPTTRKTRSALGKEVEAKAESEGEGEGEGKEKGKGRDDGEGAKERDEGRLEADGEDGRSESESESEAEGEGEGEENDVDGDAEADAEAEAGADADIYREAADDDADPEVDENEEDPDAEADEEDPDAEAEPKPEPEAEATSGDDEDFEPDGDGDVEAEEEEEEEEEEEDDEPDADADAVPDDESEGPEAEDEEAHSQPDLDAEGSEDAEGESDPGGDVAMADA